MGDQTRSAFGVWTDCGTKLDRKGGTFFGEAEPRVCGDSSEYDPVPLRESAYWPCGRPNCAPGGRTLGESIWAADASST